MSSPPDGRATASRVLAIAASTVLLVFIVGFVLRTTLFPDLALSGDAAVWFSARAIAALLLSAASFVQLGEQLWRWRGRPIKSIEDPSAVAGVTWTLVLIGSIATLFDTVFVTV